MQPLQKILYVEDEADIRSIAQIALEDLGGFTVKYCKNGKEALASMQDFMPDLILMDVMMPEMDGPTTLVKLREVPAFKTIPTVFMTAKIQADEIDDYRKLGVVDVIKKPFDPMNLAATLNEVWKKCHEKFRSR